MNSLLWRCGNAFSVFSPLVTQRCCSVALPMCIINSAPQRAPQCCSHTRDILALPQRTAVFLRELALGIHIFLSSWTFLNRDFHLLLTEWLALKASPGRDSVCMCTYVHCSHDSRACRGPVLLLYHLSPQWSMLYNEHVVVCRYQHIFHSLMVW